jgi:hypothetical protein
MQTAMVLTLQKPTQRKRVGERPEGLSGSTKRVVGVDIKQVFETIAQDWMGRMLAERIDDGALRRMIRKCCGLIEMDTLIRVIGS